MAAFINNDITTAGLIVLAKGVAGQKINYTKIVLGDGYLEEGQTPRTLTGVVSPKATVDITKLKINGDGTVAVGGIFTNQVAALGRDINPDQLRKRILSPSWGENLTGAFRVDVVKPTYKALDDTQVAKFSGHLTVSHKVESEVV